MAYIKGYEVNVTVGESASGLREIKGLETASDNMSPDYEEILVKANHGDAERTLTGGTLTINLGGKKSTLETSESSTHYAWTQFKTWLQGDTKVYFELEDGSGNSTTGWGKITAYSGDSDAKAISSWSATLDVAFDNID